MFNLNKADPKGFTLLEVMVAVAIIAIAFTSVLKLHTQTLTMNIASNFYAKAPLLAQKIISEWETGMVMDDAMGNLDDSLEEFPGFTFEMKHESVISDSLYPENMEKGDSILFEIVCTILYNHGEYHYTVKTLRLISQ
jgi:prepilin-type N-terminal cleavage/methylation domain-containing protein